MRRFAPLFAVALLAPVAPLHAQAAAGELPSHCRRDVVREERGRDARESSARRAIHAAAKAEVRAAAVAAGVERPTGLVLLLTDEARQKVRVAVFEGTVPESAALEAAPRALPRMAQWPGRGQVALGLRLDSVAPPEVPVGSQRVFCPPHLVNREEMERGMMAFITSLPPGERHTSRGMVGMLVGRTGEIIHTEMVQSSGSPRFDAFAVAMVRSTQVLPRSVNGVTTDAWVLLPVGMNFRSGR